jgi:vacuolar-type H+-ATPase subunit F/Vma7
MEYLNLRSTVPLVVEIPSRSGVPEGQASLGDIVLRAIGIKL